MHKRSFRVGFVAVSALASLVAVGENADARRLPPAYIGTADPPTDASCWIGSGSGIRLNCATTSTRFFSVPLPLDNASSVSPSRYHGNSGDGLGTRCTRANTFHPSGAFSMASAENCTSPNGFVTTNTVSVPTDGTASLAIRAIDTAFPIALFVGTVAYTP